jgi:hypothetical protein
MLVISFSSLYRKRPIFMMFLINGFDYALVFAFFALQTASNATKFDIFRKSIFLAAGTAEDEQHRTKFLPNFIHHFFI